MAAKKPPTIPGYSNYQRLPTMVLGFHGCDKAIGEAVLRGATEHLDFSTNDHDWLGDGVYFWENDPRRAMEWAIAGMSKPKDSRGWIKKPFVVGAVIELGECLNLLSRASIEEVKVSHRLMLETLQTAGMVVPQNTGRGGFRRRLDRAVIEYLHTSRAVQQEPVPPYDTVRAAFREGGAAYGEGGPLESTAGFDDRSHIQIAVRQLTKIKGYFRPICD
jgi:hypothetical protein